MPRHPFGQHVTVAIRRASSIHNPTRVQRSRLQRSPTEPITPAATGSSSTAFARSRALPWVLSSLVAGGIAFYSGALLVEAWKPCNNSAVADISRQRDVSRRYDDTADSFDSEVGISEFIMGINQMRKKLAKQCSGHVLEVSCGTGRNLGYYDISKDAIIESLTFVDLSPKMVEVCKRKWDVLFRTTVDSDKLYGRTSIKPGLVVRFLTASALETMPPPPNKGKYDTIIQTMGLCSTPSPEALLMNIVEHLDTSNPEARVLLLEHGRSYRHWLNNILDNNAEKHAEIHGCWFNRDIGALVEAAARQNGLHVVNKKRHHLGTTWIIELRPSSELVAKTRALETKAPKQPQPTTRRSWFGLT